jgi:hypothetical protein
MWPIAHCQRLDQTVDPALADFRDTRRICAVDRRWIKSTPIVVP